ncbi:MAG TPA: type II secretion system major pseudopilin GspG [Planctomycetia bacterium]|jgi:general secretion pathway protein G|nr:type II secretion system major pseudopilin GspG [Planctomycetia bacterium]
MIRNRVLAGRSARARRGFTLLEILLVVAILVTLMAIVAPNFIGQQEKAKVGIAKIDVGALEKAVNMFNVTVGRLPEQGEGLAVLAGTPNDASQGYKPILKPEDASKNDPWGSPYQYQNPGNRSSVGFDIWSNGPDKQSGTGDDIGNWPSAAK